MTYKLELPNCIKDTRGNWASVVEMDEMNVDDEDILANTEKAPKGKGVLKYTFSQRLSRLLSRCTVRVGDDTRSTGADRYTDPEYFTKVWGQAFASDRAFVAVRIRQASLGDRYVWSDVCPMPQCRAELERVVADLSKQEVTFGKRDIIIAGDGEIVSRVPSGATVRWVFTRGDDEDTISQIIRNNEEHLVSALLLSRVKEIDGKPATDLMIRRMKNRDRVALQNEFELLEGGIDLTVSVECSSCKRTFVRKLNVTDPSFFCQSDSIRCQPMNATSSLNADTGA